MATLVRLATFFVCIAGCGDNAGGPAGQSHRLEVFVLGPPDSVASLQTTGFDRVNRESSIGTADPATMFEAALGDWNEVVTLRDTKGAALTIAPWLCRTSPAAQMVVEAGGTVTESRIVEVDPSGIFRTNGRLGLGFPTRCSWASGSQTIGGVEARQDGPSLCSDATRRGTQVEVLNAAGEVVSTPEVCVAVLGTGPQTSHGLATVSLQRNKTTAVGAAFSLYLAHCLDSDQTVPFGVSGRTLQESLCSFEKISLSMGELGVEKPRPLRFLDGQWTVSALSSEPDGRHVSELDLSFEDERGASFRIRGKVDLPHVFE